jgi:hypothetical protein
MTAGCGFWAKWKFGAPQPKRRPFADLVPAWSSHHRAIAQRRQSSENPEVCLRKRSKTQRASSSASECSTATRPETIFSDCSSINCASREAF